MMQTCLQCGKVQGSAAACVARADCSALRQQLPRHVQAASSPASPQAICLKVTGQEAPRGQQAA